MNTEPVKALATVDKRKVTLDDILNNMSHDQKLALVVIGGSMGSIAFAGIIVAGLALAPTLTLSLLIGSPLLWMGSVFWQAYQKAKGE